MAEKLLSYQIPHMENIKNSIKRYGRALDASDTGTGKTYTSIACCMELKLKPFIIAPASVLASWRNCIEYFDVDYYGIINYESLQNCKYFSSDDNQSKIICPYITRRKIKIEKKKK